MGSSTAVGTSSIERYFALDDRGTALRASWRPEFGIVNLSLWREDRCVETFHLSPAEAGDLIGFLAHGLGRSVPVADSPRLRVIPTDQHDHARPAGFALTSRGRLAETLVKLADRLRP